jgi:U3 small nucleolar RNA-associated protein 13
VCFATGGEKGIIKLWRVDTGKCVYEQPASAAMASSAAGGIVELALLPGAAGLVTATQDCRLLFHRPAGGGASLAVDCQLIANNDEVTDMRFLTLDSNAGADASAAGASGAAAAAAQPTHLAVSTNSDQIHVFDVATMSCTATLAGHTDTVLALDALRMPSSSSSSGGGTMLASAGKDASVRLWSLPAARCIGEVLLCSPG